MASAAELDGDGHGMSQRRDRQAACGDHCGRLTVSGESAKAAHGKGRLTDDLKAAAAKSITARTPGNMLRHEAKTRCRMPIDTTSFRQYGYERAQEKSLTIRLLAACRRLDGSRSTAFSESRLQYRRLVRSSAGEDNLRRFDSLFYGLCSCGTSPSGILGAMETHGDVQNDCVGGGNAAPGPRLQQGAYRSV
jgi:hypothetical protein